MAAVALCVPLEEKLTTAKVRGTEPIAGCCCCLDLRGGVMLIAIVLGLIEFFFGFVYNVLVISDKGMGIPPGQPPEFPSIKLYALDEVLNMLTSLLRAAVTALAFARAWRRELKGMRTVFRVVAAVLGWSAFNTLVLTPFVLNPMICDELEQEHLAACSPWSGTNSTACLALPGWGLAERSGSPDGVHPGPRCAWDDAASRCGICRDCDGATCTLANDEVTTLFALPFLGWDLYFLFVLNAFIVRHEGGEGEAMVAEAEEPP